MEAGRRSAPRRVRAVIVHFGPASLVEACVRSLVEFAPGIEIVIVDHGDEPLSLPKNDFPIDVFSIMRPAVNSGYGSGCNAGAVGCTREFLLFLNNDVALLEGSVGWLVSALDEDVRAAVAAPQLIDETGRSMPAVHRLPSPWRLWMENVPVGRLFPFGRASEGNDSVRQPPRRCEVEAVLGAAFLVRHTEFEEVGGFDEGFFHYVEEDDLFRRMRDRDRRIVFVPEARVLHSGSGASQRISLPIRDRWKVDGFLRYAAKHHGRRGPRRTHRALLLGAQLRLLVASMTRSETSARRRERFRQLVQYLRSIKP